VEDRGVTESALNAASWEARYQTQNTGWDLGAVAPPFMSLLTSAPSLSPGRMIALGIGRGHDALYFAEHGFEVTGVDFAPSAIAATQVAAQQRQRSITLLERDIFQLLPEFATQFDYVLEHTCFCALDPSLRDQYVHLVWHLLKPGGALIGLFWAHARPGGPPFGTTVQELRDRFCQRFTVRLFDIAADSIPSRAGEEYLLQLQKPHSICA
jgi:SAM-dependent methyltransferase